MRTLLLSLALAACAPLPHARGPAAPPLAPLAPVLAAADALPSAPTFVPVLRAGAQALSYRASVVPFPGEADETRLAALQSRAEALRDETLTEEESQRLDALQARAETLQDGVLTDDERQRLNTGPSLPADAGADNSHVSP